MLMQAIDSYLQLRRAGGYQLRDTEVLLKEFVAPPSSAYCIHKSASTSSKALRNVRMAMSPFVGF